VTPTIGVPDQNSTVTAWLSGRSTLLDGRLALSLGVGYVSPRTYSLRAGIPPTLLNLTTSHSARLEAAADFHVTRRLPIWLSLKVLSNLPNAIVESPLPGSSQLGTTAVLAVDYR
jgi:hypothetical protein